MSNNLYNVLASFVTEECAMDTPTFLAQEVVFCDYVTTQQYASAMPAKQTFA